MRLFGLLVLSSFVAMTLCAPQNWAEIEYEAEITAEAEEIEEAAEAANEAIEEAYLEGLLNKEAYDNSEGKTQLHYTG
jgi:hypothetical protein